jgi:hypothetical protein
MIAYKGAVVDRPAGTTCIGKCPVCRKPVYATDAEVDALDTETQDAVKNGQSVEIVCDTCPQP